MLSIRGQEKKPQLWVGASLRKFGINTYGEPLFRVVFSDSRTQKVGGKHTERSKKPASTAEIVANDGKDNYDSEWVGYKYYPLYHGKHCYVLEKWLSSVDFGGTPKLWEIQQTDPETGLLVCGPYPSRGEYLGIHFFSPGYPSVSAVEAVIGMVLAGSNYTPAQKKEAMLKSQEREDLSRRNERLDKLKDAMPAFGFVPASTNPRRKNAEHYGVGQTPRGFPQQQNKVFTRKEA